MRKIKIKTVCFLSLNNTKLIENRCVFRIDFYFVYLDKGIFTGIPFQFYIKSNESEE